MKYIFDIDGTLSFNGVTIDPVINLAIKELLAAGNEVIFASARPIRDLLPMIPEFESQKLIGANGAMISITETIEIISGIDKQDFVYLKNLITQFDLDYIVDSSWNYSSRITQNSFIEKMIDPGHLAKQIDLNEITDPIKTIFFNVEDKLQQQLMSIIKKDTALYPIGLAGEGTVDITAKNINKYSTLDKLGVNEYIAFGNDRNDFELLEHAQTSVWINSKPSLKHFGEQVDLICDPKPEQVASLIRGFI
ncbi:HAD-IIB family hydrolase [Companilactobacillus kimchiensis]|uniref:HAD superfamily hydrolase n=1 Tax=Companilactobacillus kimchiensis TaxID=993692 RepID=A0A0R2LBA9_9LACO|nr:HAD-IIB family hydrolase [Companilactobacillus kimchiensis]KRN99107.1 HAD superfamily hydrolase [Companilactobacillus kimchiensis]